MTFNEEYKIIKDYIKDNWRKAFHEAEGVLKHPFVDPAASYRGQLWDWDSYFCNLAIMDVYDDTAKYTKGCALNFLDNMKKDGSIPYVINVNCPDGDLLPSVKTEYRDENSELNSIKPLLAQMVILANSKIDDVTWIKENYEKLTRHILHWENTQLCKQGLFVWRSCRGSGTDNHPAIYGRPLNSSAGVELNCFMYKEYLAMAKIAEICEKPKDKDMYLKKAEELKIKINKYTWDPIDGLYYHVDVMGKKTSVQTQEVTWVVPLKFRAWTCFMPMWAGIAPKEYAERMVKEHLMNEEEFYSDFGIRTMAKNEPLHNTEETSNPSNWQGPVWIVSTYLVFKGLLNYGYKEEAEKIARNLLDNLKADINKNGAMHEYYNPETGKSKMHLGFMNWNALAGTMMDEMDNL